MKQKTIILSGVNLYLGGTLKIMQDCIDSLVFYARGEYRIIALVHDEKLYKKYDAVEYISLPRSRRSWFFRLYYEYFYFKKISDIYQPDCWFSLHDATPRVKATIRAVYYHHAAPFYQGKVGWKEFRMEPSFFMFHYLYRYFYKINLKKNNYLVLQQAWLKDKLSRDFDKDRIILAPPSPLISERKSKKEAVTEAQKGSNKDKEFCFFYPSVPRIFKNFEVVAEAARILQEKSEDKFCIYLTTDGMENKYAQWLYEKYNQVKPLVFSGFLDREQMDILYQKCDCVIFPSKLETWGLPVSEAMGYRKPILIADLPYARETISGYNQVAFFDPADPDGLAKLMQDFIEDTIRYDATEKTEYQSPYASDWNQLFDILLENHSN